MTPTQARDIAQKLIDAAAAADEAGAVEINLLDAFVAADDAARAELIASIEAAERGE